MTELTKAPNLAALYAKAAVTTPLRRGGGLPDAEYVRRDVPIDLEHLAAYNRVCGFGVRDEVPATYPHVLSFPLSVQLMTDRGFPHPLVGLVHVANTIEQFRPLRVTELPTQRVRVDNERPHPKGTQFDVRTETTVDGELVWRERSTYLRRGGGSGQRGERAEVDPGEPTAQWRVPGDIGRRYAAVSGDRNPIHLHPLSAKVFGFNRAIAHGMWTLARCLGALQGRAPATGAISVEFGKPLLIPSTVDFAAREQDGGFDFGVYSRSGKPHLVGTLRN
ncbi:MaoC/PaaZ C-terminal domain-containing protein [Salinifilum aidingensis]